MQLRHTENKYLIDILSYNFTSMIQKTIQMIRLQN